MTIYFYKVENPYGYLSNFSLHGIYLDSAEWLTVEHYYQAQKFVGSPNESVIPLIAAAPTPEAAAALGRDRTLILRSDWEQVKRPIMRSAVLQKFLSHRDIQQQLLDTGDETLIEDSPKDYYWGCGADHTGHNYLGKILMAVREEIRLRLQSS
ncbi:MULTISPECIES: NADAR family protein [Planktothricoides]|uniref:NADAR domain-containing protein n=2 Tax=Planktothricoides raciborskii TaxID=132608 RepID=A0AAU8J9B6_9CYAN|nr:MULTISPECIES: NADAR domain-containing protein [Planktothricoides]KOR37488.1 Swarming motility protein ybiA [Planktothricoides sp. SR001]MBD2543066.1 NADAR family protein [Planktothricoides raciborskii FACHB-1370]MBD2581945.1 NADAR family protein [Planktothricoides raciborskii FACHB-1261]